VQFPGWTQAYNRYSYGFNSPFSWTDPTGLQNEPEPDDWGTIPVDIVIGPSSTPPDYNDLPSNDALADMATSPDASPSSGAFSDQGMTVPLMSSQAPTVGSRIGNDGPDQNDPNIGPPLPPKDTSQWLAQNKGDPSSGADIPGNVPDASGPAPGLPRAEPRNFATAGGNVTTSVVPGLPIPIIVSVGGGLGLDFTTWKPYFYFSLEYGYGTPQVGGGFESGWYESKTAFEAGDDLSLDLGVFEYTRTTANGRFVGESLTLGPGFPGVSAGQTAGPTWTWTPF
jgi:hypothetical protein